MADETGDSEQAQDLTEEEEQDLDPRVKDELDVLNSTCEEINKLEVELDHARAKFRSLLTEATQRLNQLYKKLGRCVTKARPYYDLLKESKKAQGEAQRAVVKFHRANGIYRAAKETVALAEERLMSLGENGEKREFDAAWQEMLNHATMKFMDSEKDKTLSEQEHLKKASEVAEIQKKLKTMEKSMPRTIPRSKPYFEMKERLEFQLQQEKLNVEDLVRALQSTKARYRGALTALEAISEAVHLRRKMASMLPPRTPGVGAENLSDVASDLPSINLDVSSETSCEVLSINSDDYDLLSTDGSEAGDDSPRLPPRTASLPVSPLAREAASPPRPSSPFSSPSSSSTGTVDKAAESTDGRSGRAPFLAVCTQDIERPTEGPLSGDSKAASDETSNGLAADLGGGKPAADSPEGRYQEADGRYQEAAHIDERTDSTTMKAAPCQSNVAQNWQDNNIQKADDSSTSPANMVDS